MSAAGLRDGNNRGSAANGRGFAAALSRRGAVLRIREFRRFSVGYATSSLGTSMSAVAVTFGVLASGGSPAGLGLVMAAGILPQVLLVLGGGTIADRAGRRTVMLASDGLCFAAQSSLAAAMLTGRPPLWLFAALAAAVGTGAAFSGPALSGLMVEIVPAGDLAGANAVCSLAQSATGILGPALAGLLVAAASPASAIAADAASYAVSAAALASLRVNPASAGSRSARRQSLLRDVVEGWGEFRSQTWLWLITAQFALYNLITRAPFLLLGPILAGDYLGGARARGFIMAGFGAGSVAGGLAALGRRPRRPLVLATLATSGFPLPSLLLALHSPSAGVTAAAVVAGACSALWSTFFMTTLQQQVPAERVSRASSFATFGAFGPGTAGLALAGPVAALAGAGRVLGIGAAWSVVGTAAVLAWPAIRTVVWKEPVQRD